MKKIQKILSVFLIVAFNLSLSIPALAVENASTDLIPKDAANEIFEKYPSNG